MSHSKFIDDYLAHVRATMAPDGLHSEMIAVKERLERSRREGRLVMLAGNGASATIASHYALDFTKQAGIRSMAFNDAALLTAYGNDYGYENWVRRAVEHHGAEGDVAVLVSTSGRSTNMVNAAEYCRSVGITVVTLTGFETANPLRERGELNLWADSRAYNVVEAIHGLWLGVICDLIIGKREYGVTPPPEGASMRCGR